MPTTLSWNEIKKRAVEFSKEWENETNERAEAQSFWNDFFNVFGVQRKRVGTFEESVKKLEGAQGFIDLFWPGVLLGEAKSRGENLGKAKEQALNYTFGLSEKLMPRYILVSDFEYFVLTDLETREEHKITLKDFPQHIEKFGFIAGYEKQEYKEQDSVNTKAVKLMAQVYEAMAESGYDGHVLKVLLVRLLFCFFAEDTGIFNSNKQYKHQFLNYIELNTKEDGSDLGMHLSALFDVLNTPEEKRQSNTEKDLLEFPYINGGLFEENLRIASFDSDLRKILVKCGEFNWSQISPAIFGSLFQGVMDENQRRHLGAHYTSEINILKVIKPLFLDDLREEFEKVKHNEKRLVEFHNKIAGLKFLDPACGCGNFLVIAYRELKLLELEILDFLYGRNVLPLNVENFTKVSVEQMFGIEIEEFPARIAQTALWLMNHQMNIETEKKLGRYKPSIPLIETGHITIGDALEIDWESVVPKEKLNYILGNPPFIGSKLMTQTQRDQIIALFDKDKGAGVLDFVSGWYVKAAQYIQNTNIVVTLVSTNSITQGEQVGILWNELLSQYWMRIHFAHRTFKWSNEASGKAAVYCVIIGFANFDTNNKRIFDYENVSGEAHEIKVKNINPYLVDAPDILILKRSKPVSRIPELNFGSMPNDDGNLLLSDSEKHQLEQKDPIAAKYIKPLISAKEFLNNIPRWCLWLVDAQPEDIKQSEELLKRLEAVKSFRQSSTRRATVELARYPMLFGENRQPNSDYIAIPSTTSENRKYIPMGFLTQEYIVNNSCHIIPGGTLYHFGILESEMHMAWVKYVCGRLKSDYRYSKDIVYNNFPWPENVSDQKKQLVEQAAQTVLDVRLKYPNSSLADLYNPLTTPPDLTKAHAELDRLVDACYGKKSFTTDADRVSYLFELYKQMI